jgi:hypothetical protein
MVCVFRGWCGRASADSRRWLIPADVVAPATGMTGLDGASRRDPSAVDDIGETAARCGRDVDRSNKQKCQSHYPP